VSCSLAVFRVLTRFVFQQGGCAHTHVQHTPMNNIIVLIMKMQR
jgi:hypothetical protein